LLLHLGVSLLMLGNTQIFDSSVEETEQHADRSMSSVTTRATQPHVTPLLILLFGLCIYYSFSCVTRGMSHFTRRALQICACGDQGEDEDFLQRTENFQVHHLLGFWRCRNPRNDRNSFSVGNYTDQLQQRPKAKSDSRSSILQSASKSFLQRALRY